MNKSIFIANGEQFTRTTYNGISVIIDANGYYNASKICRENDKQFTDWFRNKDAQEILQLYSEELKIDVVSRAENPLAGGALIYKREYTGAQLIEYADFQGYYVHEEIVHHVANWANKRYAIKVARIMNAINANQTAELNRLIAELRHENDEQAVQIINLNDQVNHLNTQIDDKSVRTEDVKRRHLTLYRRTNGNLALSADERIDKIKNNKNFERVLMRWVFPSSMHVRMQLRENRLIGKYGDLNVTRARIEEELRGFNPIVIEHL